MKEIFITKNFDHSKVIGQMKIDEKLLPKRPIYHFGIGGKIKKQKNGVISDFELLEVSLLLDEDKK